MFNSFDGVVIKTAPRLIIQLSTGKELSPRPTPEVKRFRFGDKVKVMYDHHRGVIGEIFPECEGTDSYCPLNLY